MAAPRLTHDDREKMVLTELETSFPNFAGRPVVWTKVPVGHDPPDFISHIPSGAVGLELVEWLDGSQMTSAKGRESQHYNAHRVLAHDWENRYQPQHFSAAFPSPRPNERIATPDEACLQQEFLAFAADVDRTWMTNTERWGRTDYRMDFPTYPLLAKYFSSINFVEGTRVAGMCWIHLDGDGGAFDGNVIVKTLESALDGKLTSYSAPSRQAHLKTHALTELDLLVHGGSNIHIYNAPSGHLALEEIARRGTEYYAAHAQRDVFNRVWFFHWIDTMDELN
jgi:hypothetical protein